MELKKISYNSAVFSGVFFTIMYFVIGILEVIMRNTLASHGIEVGIFRALVIAPLIVGIIGYLIVLIAIAIYNCVAMRYPISWVVKK